MCRVTCLALGLVEGVEYFRGGALAGLDRAVHVAAPLGRGFGAGPVQQARWPAQRGPELRPGAGREVRAVATAGPLLSGPVVLDVIGRLGRGGPEVPAERGEHLGSPPRGIGTGEPPPLSSGDESEQDAG